VTQDTVRIHQRNSDAEKLIDELLRRFVPQDQLQKIPVHAPDEGIVRRWNKEEDIQALASKGKPSNVRSEVSLADDMIIGTRAGPHPLPARITAENEPHSSKIRSRKRSRIDQDEDIVQPSGDYQYGGTASGSKRRAQRVDTTNNLGGSRLQTIQGPVNLNTSALQNGFMPNINPVHMPPTQNFGGFEQRFYPPQAYGDMTQMLPTVPSLNGMFNRQTAMETMRAIQEMRDMVGLMQSMMPQPATTSSGQKNNRGQHESQLCLDFATKGFCPAGPSCPYSHGNTLTVPLGPGAQDPSVPASASETLQSSSLTLSHPGAKSSRKSQQPRQPVFASRYPGRYAGAYNATIVIQRIPEEHCSKEEVREFCSQFGNVVEVVVHASDRLAIVRFDDMDSAHNVFRSSEPIFNNRFVSVSWYRPDLLPEEQSYEAAVNGTHLQMTKPWDNLKFNMEEALEKIARDQKKFEERKAKIETAKRLDANYEERLRMRAEIRAKGEDLPEDPELLEVLKKKLANLEEQGAEIDRRDSARFNHSGYHYHSYYPRARYSHRGGAFSGVNRLDNRPRSVSLTLADPADPSADQTIEEAQQEILVRKPL